MLAGVQHSWSCRMLKKNKIWRTKYSKSISMLDILGGAAPEKYLKVKMIQQWLCWCWIIENRMKKQNRNYIISTWKRHQTQKSVRVFGWNVMLAFGRGPSWDRNLHPSFLVSAQSVQRDLPAVFFVASSVLLPVAELRASREEQAASDLAWTPGSPRFLVITAG